MRLFWWIAIAILVPVGAAAQSAASITQAVRSIKPDDVLSRIATIADDSMRGRNTPSPELDLTAQYIASQFRQFGLEPGGDEGSFVQRYPLYRIARRLEVTTSTGLTWRGGEEVIQVAGGGARVASSPVLVISGSGDLTEETDVRGSVVLLTTEADNPRGFGPETQALMAKLREEGAAAIIAATNFPERTWGFLVRRQGRSQLSKGWEGRPDGVPVLVVQAGTAKAVLSAPAQQLTSGSGLSIKRLENVQLAVTSRQDLEELSAPNVVGILEGSDPELKKEYVVFSAHMDHVGVGQPVNGDSIYNGADDDASGTIAVVEAAEAFSKLRPRPKRSLIFLTVSGEEKGLWGSEYFASHPTVPASQIVADLNTDMVGRNWPDTIVVIGKEHSDLGTTLNRVNKAHPELNMTAIDDIWPEERFYYRSDHFNFARKGIPILFFFNGTHPDYHRPSDEVEKIDAEKESRIVKLVFYLGLEIANAAERPKWNPESYRQIVEGPGR
ncbi:MAG: M20/M25/M40 family metallo-hydrolase [Gemmatimonadales bacterium]